MLQTPATLLGKDRELSLGKERKVHLFPEKVVSGVGTLSLKTSQDSVFMFSEEIEVCLRSELSRTIETLSPRLM
jgi:hypothetical protein